MLEQRPRLLEQLACEWRFARRHPSVWLIGLVLYGFSLWLLATLTGWGWEFANAVLLGLWIVGFTCFRAWRLRRA